MATTNPSAPSAMEPAGSIGSIKRRNAITDAHFIAAVISVRSAAEFLRDQGFTLADSLTILANRT